MDIYHFEDGAFTFWTGDIVTIRVRIDRKAGDRWLEKGLPRGVTIRPATKNEIVQWLEQHEDYPLSCNKCKDTLDSVC